MYVEELNNLYLMLNIERLKTIHGLQKGILRRQNRYKRILNIYMKLHTEWSKIDQDESIGDDESNCNYFKEHHSLLQQMIENHLKDYDQLESLIQREDEIELQNKQALLDERQRIDEIQQELSMTFRQEDKIAKTIQAARTPTGAYAGFMENVLSGIKNPEEEINYEEYSTYCQVKWTLEGDDREYLQLLNSMFELTVEKNTLIDSINDKVDMQYILYVLGDERVIKPKNLYNVYGFDGFWSFNDEYDETNCSPGLEKENIDINELELDIPKYNDQEIRYDINQNCIEIKPPSSSPGVDSTKKYEEMIRRIDEKMDLLLVEKQVEPLTIVSKNLPPDQENLVVENKRFSSYLSESILENEETLSTMELDLDIFTPSSPDESMSSNDETTISDISMEESHDAQIRRSSQVVSTQTKEPVKPRSSVSSQSSISSEQSTIDRLPSISSISSTSSDKSKPNKRRINARRHKLKGTANKDLFFLPSENFDEEGFKEDHFSKEPLPAKSASLPPDVVVTTPEKPKKNNSFTKLFRRSSSSSASSGGHKKLQRIKGDKSITENDIKKTTNELKVSNVQTIFVDGKLLKVGDLTPYSLDRLSIKNRPRKLSIHKNRDK